MSVDILVANVLSAATHHEALGVAPTSSKDEVASAYRRLCLVLHPDKCSGVVGAPDAFLRVQNAYEGLTKGDGVLCDDWSTMFGGAELTPEQYAAMLEAVSAALAAANVRVVRRVCRGAGCIAEAAGTKDGLCDKCEAREKSVLGGGSKGMFSFGSNSGKFFPGVTDKCRRFGCLERAKNPGELCPRCTSRGYK